MQNTQLIKDSHENTQRTFKAQQYRINPIKKWTKDFNRHFTTADIQMASKHMSQCCASYVLKEMQIKTTNRYH